MNPNANLYLKKADLLNSLFHKKRAMDNYEKAFELDPASYSAFSHLIRFHSKHPEKLKELYLKFSQTYTEAQQLDPNNAELYSKGGYYYNKLANLTHDSIHYQVALDNYNQFLKLRPSKIAHYYVSRAVLQEYLARYRSETD